MAKTVADVMKMVKENEVKFVDFRFTDTRGKQHHTTVPVSHFDEEKFASGHAFDGSSIAGWKGIEASDMQLVPDPCSANIDPFFEETTLIMTCDVIEPSDGKAYDRDPRSIGKRAEAYLKASGLGDTAFFGPEPEFFIFDGVRWSNEPGNVSVEIDEYEAPWNTGAKLEGGNRGHRPTVKGGYFPVPPVDSTHDMRAEMSLILESLGIPVEVFHHEVAGAGQNEIGTRFSTLVERRRTIGRMGMAGRGHRKRVTRRGTVAAGTGRHDINPGGTSGCVRRLPDTRLPVLCRRSVACADHGPVGPPVRVGTGANDAWRNIPRRSCQRCSCAVESCQL